MQVGALLDPLGGGYLPLETAGQADPTPAPASAPDSVGAIKTDLANPDKVNARLALVAGLEVSSRPPTTGPLNLLAAAADRVFLQPPMMIGVAAHG